MVFFGNWLWMLKIINKLWTLSIYMNLSPVVFSELNHSLKYQRNSRCQQSFPLYYFELWWVVKDLKQATTLVELNCCVIKHWTQKQKGLLSATFVRVSEFSFVATSEVCQKHYHFWANTQFGLGNGWRLEKACRRHDVTQDTPKSHVDFYNQLSRCFFNFSDDLPTQLLSTQLFSLWHFFTL